MLKIKNAKENFAFNQNCQFRPASKVLRLQFHPTILIFKNLPLMFLNLDFILQRKKSILKISELFIFTIP